MKSQIASSVVLEQVTNGLAVRMAVLFLVSGGKVASLKQKMGDIN